VQQLLHPKTNQEGKEPAMKTYTAYFRTDADWADKIFQAKTPKQALAKARAYHSRNTGELLFQEYSGGLPVNEIEITDPDGDELAVWRDDDLWLRLAAQELLDALEAQTEAAQAVIDAWEKGDLAGAVRMLDGCIPAARAAIAEAKAGVS
jgi:hypothetical protein